MTRRTLLAAVMVGLACGGGGGDGGSGPNGPPVTVTVTPARDTLTVGTSATFGAAVANSGDPGVTWTVVGAASKGSIDAAGVYTAGTTPQSVLLIAASDSVPSVKDTAVVVVVAAPNGTMTVGDSVLEQQAGLTAGVPAQAGMTYTWSVTGGTLTGGQGTAGITFTTGAPGTVQVGVTVRNLADSAVTTLRGVAVVPAPAITSFIAARDTVTTGEGTSLTATFVNGTGSISQGVGAVTSGAVTPVGPFLTPYVATTYQLTVTGFRGATRTAQVTAVAVHPPVLNVFRAITSRAPVGGHGVLEVGWNVDPGVQASIAPGIGLLQATPVQTPVFAAAGPVTFTLTVRSPADSALTDTATITAVTPTPGGFQSTGSLGAARAHPAMALLQDGRVLVTGGTDFVAPGGLATAEIYDPASGSFTPTGNLTGARSFPVSATLPDGQVLVAGDTSTDLYDPASGTFTAGKPSRLAVVRHAVGLQDGRVLLIGATGGGTNDAATIYDPVADTVLVTGGPATSRSDASAILLDDGRVLYVGGLGAGNAPIASAEIYDPGTGSFTPTGDMVTPHWQGAFARLADGRVLAAGGFEDFIATRATHGEVFDPGTGTWAAVGELATPRTVPTATLLASGAVLLAGGIDAAARVPSFDEVFDPASGEFVPTLDGLGQPRTLAPALRLNSGAVLLVGGAFGNQAVAAAELFQ